MADPWAGTLKGRPAAGAVAERSRTTSMRDVEMFSAMTGDMNPLHYDAALAERSPFGGLIVQGGVTSGLLNAVVAEDLPGPGDGLPRRGVALRQGRAGRRDDQRSRGGDSRA